MLDPQRGQFFLHRTDQTGPGPGLDPGLTLGPSPDLGPGPGF